MVVGRTTFIVLASVILAIAAAGADSERRTCCPQTSDGWVLFEDSNPRVPDFWKADSVIVEAIDVCTHGIHLYFFSKEDGQPRYVALVIARPTRTLFETRVPYKWGDAPLEVRLKRAKKRYACLVATLEHLFEVSFSPEGRVDFETHPLGECRIIAPSRKLILRYRETEVKLRGYLDVYMTMYA